MSGRGKGGKGLGKGGAKRMLRSRAIQKVETFEEVPLQSSAREEVTEEYAEAVRGTSIISLFRVSVMSLKLQ